MVPSRLMSILSSTVDTTAVPGTRRRSTRSWALDTTMVAASRYSSVRWAAPEVAPTRKKPATILSTASLPREAAAVVVGRVPIHTVDVHRRIAPQRLRGVLDHQL